MRTLNPIMVSLSFLVLTSINEVQAQSTIPSEYRGSYNQIARGVLDGNNIRTNFRNHGEMARWGDIPWGEWYERMCDRFDENCDISGGTHIDGIGFIFAAEVPGERAKWSHYYGEGIKDTTLNPVIINYRNAGVRQSPYSEDEWGWMPLNGFYNLSRRDPITDALSRVPAASTDPESWPGFWPDRLTETDQGWEGSWNGFRGKGLVTGDQETFYVMDDFSDYEYAFGLETEGPHSPFGVYYPSPSDSSIGGLGLQTEVRTFQWADVIGKDMLFTQYRTTNVSEKDLERAWTMILIEYGMGADDNDDNLEFIPEQNLIIVWDEDGIASPVTGGTDYNLGYVGFLLLEHSIEETNGIDDDLDGITDESKFNGPGELLEGKEAIDAYLAEHYDMDRFDEMFIDLENFPAYASGRWWTGDEDLDWVAHEDFNGNGIQDFGEFLLDDVGRDGLGPDDEGYPGPDEGESDGMPTQGEPNFGEQDMLEAENRDLSSIKADFFFYEGVDGLRDDTWLFKQIKRSQINPDDDFSNPLIGFSEPLVLTGVGPFSLKSGTSSYFITALIFAEDRDELMHKVKVAQAVYESDYGQSMFLTSNEESFEAVPTRVSLFQNYPNPFNPSTVISYQLPVNSEVELKVFDMLGREVAILVDDRKQAGTYEVTFNGRGLASGMYIYRLRANDRVITKKLTLIK